MIRWRNCRRIPDPDDLVKLKKPSTNAPLDFSADLLGILAESGIKLGYPPGDSCIKNGQAGVHVPFLLSVRLAVP